MKKIRASRIFEGEDAMQPIEECGTKPLSSEEEKVSNRSPFGNYLFVLCRYLQISQLELAQASGIRDSTISNFMGDKRRRPEDLTLKRFAKGFEAIATAKRDALKIARGEWGGPFFLPPDWQAEFFLSVRVETNEELDEFAFFSFFRGKPVKRAHVRRMRAFHTSYGWILDEIEGRSRSEK